MPSPKQQAQEIGRQVARDFIAALEGLRPTDDEMRDIEWATIEIAAAPFSPLSAAVKAQRVKEARNVLTNYALAKRIAAESRVREVVLGVIHKAFALGFSALLAL